MKFIFPLFLAVCVLTHGAYAQQNTRNITQNKPQTFNCDSCNAHNIFSDDFEQYPSGSFPTGNWSYTGNADILIVNTLSAGGAQSLVMNGDIAGCWEAITCLPLPPSFNCKRISCRLLFLCRHKPRPGLPSPYFLLLTCKHQQLGYMDQCKSAKY